MAGGVQAGIAGAVVFFVLVSFSGANALGRCSSATLGTYMDDSIALFKNVSEQATDESDAYAQFDHLLHKVRWCYKTATSRGVASKARNIADALGALSTLAYVETTFAKVMGEFGNLSQGRSMAQDAMGVAKSMLGFARVYADPRQRRLVKQWSDSVYYTAQREDYKLQHDQALRSIH